MFTNLFARSDTRTHAYTPKAGARTRRRSRRARRLAAYASVAM